MQNPHSERASPGRGWLSQDCVQACGVERSESTETTAAAQWEMARDLEARARERGRNALLLRGVERLQQCAIATAQAMASKSLAQAAGRA